MEKKEEENKDMATSPGKASSTPATPLRSRKRSSVLRFGRAVLIFMARSRPPLKKVTPAQVDAVVRSGRTTSLWKCLASGVRPLHHQLDQHQEAAPVKALPALPSLTKVDSFHDVFTPAASPLHSSVDGTSTYASAEDLRALDACEDGERDAKRDDGDNGGNGEPNEIDIKAEEFIARFYEQQRLESIALQGV